jgi:hypothetical protein
MRLRCWRRPVPMPGPMLGRAQGRRVPGGTWRRSGDWRSTQLRQNRRRIATLADNDQGTVKYRYQVHRDSWNRGQRMNAGARAFAVLATVGSWRFRRGTRVARIGASCMDRIACVRRFVARRLCGRRFMRDAACLRARVDIHAAVHRGHGKRRSVEDQSQAQEDAQRCRSKNHRDTLHRRTHRKVAAMTQGVLRMQADQTALEPR